MREATLPALSALVKIPNGDLGVTYRQVVGFSGYAVGDDGNVWSAWARRSTGIGTGTKSFISGSWHRLKPLPTRNRRYWEVGLYKNRRVHRVRLHHAVLLAFVGPRPKGMEGCHDPDRNTANCRLENLRWDTKKSNEKDKIAQGTSTRGERNHNAKLSTSQVRDIRLRIAAGEPQCLLAKEFSVSKYVIRDIKKRKSWAWLDVEQSA